MTVRELIFLLEKGHKEAEVIMMDHFGVPVHMDKIQFPFHMSPVCSNSAVFTHMGSDSASDELRLSRNHSGRPRTQTLTQTKEKLMHQKTWIELLGTDASNCVVIGGNIVQRINPSKDEVRYKILREFATYRAAARAMHHWKNEIAEANAPTIKIMDPLENMEYEWASRNTPLPEYEIGGEG